MVGCGIELPAAVDFIARPVKLTQRLGPCVTQPTRCFSHFLFQKQLNAITATFAKRHDILPILVSYEISGTVAVLQHKGTSLVIGTQMSLGIIKLLVTRR